MSTTRTHSPPLEGTTTSRSQPGWVWLVARCGGALALLAVGAVHLQQYVKLYSAVPTIGTLFVLNFVGATVLGTVLLMPLQRWSPRWGGVLVALAAAGGLALAAATFVMLAISESRPLFGFREPGYDPVAIAASRGAEVTAVVLLGAYLLARLRTGRPVRRR